MDYNTFKEAVQKALAEMQVTGYELYYKGSQSTSVSAFGGEINDFSSSEDGGVCLRVIKDGKMGYASTESLTGEDAVSLVCRAMSNADSIESEDKVFLTPAGKEYVKVDNSSKKTASTDKLIETALEAVKKVTQQSDLISDNSQAEVFSSKTMIAIANSLGLDLSYENCNNAVFIEAVATDGKEMTNAYDLKTGDLDEIDLDKLAAKAAEKAAGKLGGDVAPTAVCPVVFSSGAMSSLLATYSPVFSGENAAKGLSILGGKEGEMIASEAVTLVDDPFYKDSAMPMPFDAEGTPTSCKSVIDAGVLKTLLYDLKTAAAEGKESTGNASKSGYAATISIAPFSMYILPGDITEEEMLKKAGNGVYINSLGGLHAGANVISGDFSLQSAGFLIENGVKTTPVKSFTVAGNFYDVLKKIVCVSDEVELSGSGITAFGSPCVLVDSLSIAGK